MLVTAWLLGCHSADQGRGNVRGGRRGEGRGGARGGGVRGRGRGGARGRGSGGVRGGIGRGRGGGRRKNFVPSTIPWQSADTDTDTAPTPFTFDEPTGPRISLPSNPQPVDFLSTLAKSWKRPTGNVIFAYLCNIEE